MDMSDKWKGTFIEGHEDPVIELNGVESCTVSWLGRTGVAEVSRLERDVAKDDAQLMTALMNNAMKLLYQFKRESEWKR